MRLRFIDGRRIKAQFQLELKDMWIGLFWRRTEMCYHYYICLVPFIPLHITYLRKQAVGMAQANPHLFS